MTKHLQSICYAAGEEAAPGQLGGPSKLMVNIEPA
jgi:hypothetical protein